jgi:serine/threonine-protein kinase
MSEIVNQIGRYRILGELGRGGFGRVYRAYDASVGRELAIKLLTGGGREMLARFRNEAQVAGNLRHENIVTVYEYGEHEGQPFLAMEYLEGEDLHRILTTRKHLTLLEKCNIMSQMAEGLFCAHRSGIVHRDIKPANIMVLPDGRVKIMDFGIARITQNHDATRLTQEGWLIGTVLYMAPEQFSGGEVDSLADIFAYGVVFYELLTGKHPFEAADSRQLMYNISFTDPPPVSTLAPDCPEALDHIVQHLLAKDRDVRYQSLKDAIFDTELVLTDLRRQRAEELVAEAQRYIEAKNLEKAQALVGEALGLDASHRIARGLYESLQKQLHQRALQPRIEAFTAAGEDHLSARRLAEAIQSFEAALKLDRENLTIQGRLAFTRGLVERYKTAQSLVAEARRELANLNLTLASRKASEALRHDPENTAATELLTRIQCEVENRQREQRIDAALRRAEGLILLRSYDEAIDLLEGLGEDSKSPKVDHLLKWLIAEKQERARKERLQAEMSAATELLRARSLDEAVARLEALVNQYPNEQEVGHLLSYAQKELQAEARARAVDEVVANANGLVKTEDFTSAVALLENGLKQYPGEIKLIRLLGSATAAKAAWERRRAIDSAVREASFLQEQHRYAEAVELVEAGLRDYVSDPVLLELLEQLERNWARKRREDAVRKIVEQAERLLERREPFEAQQQLRQAVLQFSDEESIASLLRRADEEALALEKERAIDAIAREASARAEARDFDGALAAIDQGLQKWSGVSTLLSLRRQTAAAQAAWKRHSEIQAVCQRATACAAEGNYAEAVDQLTSARCEYGAEPDLEQLQARVALDWERHKRREAVRSAVSEARLLLNRARLDEAADLLNDARSRYADEPALTALSAQVGEAIQARERTRAIERLIRESQESVAARRFDEARAPLEKALAAFPAEPSILRQLKTVKAAREEWEEQQAIERAIAEAGQFAADRNFDQALEALSRVALPSPALAEARQRIERERSEYDRRTAIAKGAGDAAALIDNGQPEEALKLLGPLSSRYPGESNWPPLVSRAETALAERKAANERRQAIEQAVREGERLSAQNRFEDAFESLRQALSRFPGDDALVEFDERLKLRHEQYRRVRAVEQVAAQGQALLDAGRLEEAVTALSQSCAAYPAEAPLRALLARAEKALESRREIERVVQEGRELLEEGGFEDAVKLLERTLAAYPGNPELTQLAASAREKLEIQRRDEAIEAIVEGATSVARTRNFDRALAMAERGLEKWPHNERLLEVQRSIRADRDQWQREQVRRQVVEDLQQLIRQERYAEARERAKRTLASYPGDADLTRIENECAVRETLARAAAAAAGGQPHEGLRLLEPFAATYGGRPEWVALESRLKEERASLERQAAIRKIAADARDLASRNDFDRAFELLARAGREFPNEAAIDEPRRAVAALKAAYDRKVSIENRAAEGVRLAAAGQLSQAIDYISKALEEFPDEPALVDLRRRLDDERQAEQRRKQRQQGLDELAALDASIARASGSGPLSELRAKVERIAAAYPRDGEIRSAAAPPIKHVTDIERAKGALLQRDFKTALQLCRQYLARFPEHATFSPLEKTALQGRRAAELEEIRRRADAEPDLSRRAKLLEEALSHYPEETSLRSELQFTRNKLGLVETIVAAARAHEASGSWELALEQWNKLATIYDKYPGLSREIERVRAAGARAEAEAVSRWIGQIEPLIEAGDFVKAHETVMRALSELPAAAALRQIARSLDELRDRQRQIRDLLRGLRALREGGEWDKFQAAAKKALQLSAAHGELRKTVLEKLDEQGRAVAGGDWNKAEALVALIQDSESRYAVPEDLQRAIDKGKRQAAVESAQSASERRRAQGDLRGALTALDSAFRQFPDDSRLQSVRRSLGEQLRKERERVTVELNQIRVASDRSAAITELDPLNARVAAIAGQAQPDPELSALATETARAIAARRRQLGRAQLTTSLRRFGKPIGIAAAVMAVAALGWLGLKGRRGISVTIASNVAGASVSVADLHCATPQCVLLLKPGSYKLTATKSGYQAITRPITVVEGKSDVTVPLAFQPLPEQLEVNANFENGSVSLDGGPASPLRNSQFSISGVTPGTHEIRITGGDADFSAQWRSAPGEQPELLGPVSATNVRAAVVANGGGKGAVACNCDLSKATVDGATAGPAQPNGTATLPKLDEGPRQISIDGRNIVVDVRPNPALNIFLNVGGNPRNPAAQPADTAKRDEKLIPSTPKPVSVALEIAGAQPLAQVKIDGKPVGQTDAGGRFRYEAARGAHVVELSKDGFAPARFDAQFEPGGEPVRPKPAQVAMAKLPVSQPQSAPESTKADTEPQDWAAVANSSRIEDLQDYLRKHLGGAHAREAQTKIDQLQRAAAARGDDADWNVVDKNSKADLQDYLNRHNGGGHAQDARNILDAIQKRETAAAAAATAEREKAKKRAEQSQADIQAVQRTLNDFEAAYNKMDARAIAQVYANPDPKTMSANYFKLFKSIAFQLTPTATPLFSGETATVTCTKSMSGVLKTGDKPTGTDRVRVTLTRTASGSGWMIRDIKSF